MDAQYFINKFEAIPEEKWCINYQMNGKGQRCALGHLMPEDAIRWSCYGHQTSEGLAISKLFEGCINGVMKSYYPEFQGALNVAVVNNGGALEYQQSTPKQRILAALRDIQKKEQEQKALLEPLCSECGKPITQCECEEEEVDEEDWGAGAAEEVDYQQLELV